MDREVDEREERCFFIRKGNRAYEVERRKEGEKKSSRKSLHGMAWCCSIRKRKSRSRKNEEGYPVPGQRVFLCIRNEDGDNVPLGLTSFPASNSWRTHCYSYLSAWFWCISSLAELLLLLFLSLTLFPLSLFAFILTHKQSLFSLPIKRGHTHENSVDHEWSREIRDQDKEDEGREEEKNQRTGTKIELTEGWVQR